MSSDLHTVSSQVTLQIPAVTVCNQRYHSLSFQAVVSGFRDHMQYDRERERRSRSGNFTAVDEKASFGRWKLSLPVKGLPNFAGASPARKSRYRFVANVLVHLLRRKMHFYLIMSSLRIASVICHTGAVWTI